MKKSRFTKEQIIGILRQQESGRTTARFAAATESAVRRFTNGRRSTAVSIFQRLYG